MTKDWSANRERIIHLYKSEGRSLENVREIMRVSYQFEAAIRTYRNWLKRWGVWKYTRDPSRTQAPVRRPYYSAVPQHRHQYRHESAAPSRSRHLSVPNGHNVPCGLPTPPLRNMDYRRASVGSIRGVINRHEALYQSQNAMQASLSSSPARSPMSGPYVGSLQSQQTHSYPSHIRPPYQTLTPPRQPVGPRPGLSQAMDTSPSLQNMTTFPNVVIPMTSAPSNDAMFSDLFATSSSMAGDLAILNSPVRFNLQQGLQTPAASPYTRTTMPDRYYPMEQQQSPARQTPQQQQLSTSSWGSVSSVSTAPLLTPVSASSQTEFPTMPNFDLL